MNLVSDNESASLARCFSEGEAGNVDARTVQGATLPSCFNMFQPLVGYVGSDMPPEDRSSTTISLLVQVGRLKKS